jgi:regulation of enolase protein 1 (concanavalin A-like superfamily)
MFESMAWHQEPMEWHQDGERLEVRTDDHTDFWRRTHYGFIRDNGHFYYQPVTGDFTVSVTLSGDFQELYDQLGLMLRLNDSTWIKAGLEFLEGKPQLSAVFTREYSDWSLAGDADQAQTLSLRMTRQGAAVRVEYQRPGERWTLMRVGYFAEASECLVGLMCCSPQRQGFRAVFSDFRIGPVTDDALHS